MGCGADGHVRRAAVRRTVCVVGCALGLVDTHLLAYRVPGCAKSQRHTLKAVWDLLVTKAPFLHDEIIYSA